LCSAKGKASAQCLPHEAKQALSKIPWKQTQANLCSIFGSQHYNSGHFKHY